MNEASYLDTLEKTREAALASVGNLPLSDRLRVVAEFHETAQRMATEQFGGRVTAIAAYHGILSSAATEAADHLGATP